jgi:hypothetical protein
MLSQEKKRKMSAIMEALAADREGKRPESVCPVCETHLTVIKIPEIGRTVVTCEKGCTTARFSYEPQVK